MKTMTATQAARNFAGLLDAVEHGDASADFASLTRLTTELLHLR